VAGSTLALQVLLTRIFAAVLFYHFAFLAVSLALLGIGAGALLIYVRPNWFDRLPLERALARWSLAFGGLLPVTLFLLVRLDYTYDGVSAGFLFNLAAACVLAGLPFLAAGIAIGLAVRAYARSIGRLYAFDLAGAGIGAALVVPLLWLLDAPTLVVGTAAVAGVAATLFAGPARAERAAGLGLAGIATVLAVISAAGSLYYLELSGPRPLAERWTPLSRVLGYQFGEERAFIIYDRVIGQVIPYDGGRLPTWRDAQEGPESVGYALARPGQSLIIGGGGGRDIFTALDSGAERVDVIELNRAIRDVVEDDLGDFSGSPYALPRVSTAIGDGRSTLAARDRRYDSIQLGFTDTFSPSSAQAFALTENNLYTLEAFEEYLSHLTPRGVLIVARPRRHSGEEAMRATVLALEALSRMGVDRPERNVVVLLGTYDAPFRTFFYGTVLARLKPYTAAELSAIRRLADRRGQGVAFAPGGPYFQEWGELALASSHTAFCRDYELDVCPPTDDKPFFFNMRRLGGQAQSFETGAPEPMSILLLTLAVLSALSLAAMAAPLWLVRHEGRPSVGSLSFFAAIGVGFLCLEIVLIQRFVLFLGFPTYALSVVLFALLVFTGLGSLLTTRPGFGTQRALTVALAAAAALIAAAAFGLEPVLHALIDAPFAARVGVALLLLLPVGITLGMAMPIGLRRLMQLYPSGVPWAWGVNGIASVVASALTVAVAINFGFTVTTLVALACYLWALGHVVLGRWAPAEVEPAGPADVRAPAGAPSAG
jgi:spermidine synthase